MKTIGIVVHSAEGGALCFRAACRAGAAELGPHLHPDIVLSAIPMGRSLPAWKSGDRAVIEEYLSAGVRQVADAGADFFICPDNTAHIVLDEIVADLPIPGLHIADAVCQEITARGWQRVGLLGTEWTMTGKVYPAALQARGLGCLVPEAGTRERLDSAIFDELCQGLFLPETTERFVHAIAELRSRGAECVVLGCTEIPLIITDANSPLPVLDSTRLLAACAVREALDGGSARGEPGWLGRA